MPMCPYCPETRESEFTEGGDRCRECKRSYNRGWYQANKAEQGRRVRKNKALSVARARAFVEAQKAKPCSDCRLCFPTCAMQFDHVRGQKRDNVATLVAKGCSIEVVQSEIAKCELVCANCHAIRCAATSRGLLSHRSGVVQSAAQPPLERRIWVRVPAPEPAIR